MYPSCSEIATYLAEDIGSGDLTAQLIPNCIHAEAEVIGRENFILCGQAWFEEVFRQLSLNIEIKWEHAEGERIKSDELICKLSGPARALLSGERTALNLLQTLSATATISRNYVDAIYGTDCKILDTRKTIPGLRLAQKYAVRCGGGLNHRLGLYDGILIKENHIIAAGSISEAVRIARSSSHAHIEVEVENLAEFKQALDVAPDRIMLDNFSIIDTIAAVQLNSKQIELEASGNITLENVRSIAETGVDFISIGALTKNLVAIDLSMRIKLLPA